MDQTLVLNLNQAAIDGIRAAGATSQYIFVEGNAWTGAWSWTSNNDNMKDLTDTEDKIVYEMHQYLDSDSSGTSETCVSSTIGKERLEAATTWLKDNGKKGFIGEFAGGVNSVCETAVEGMLSYMSDNSDVWMGAEWWSAGPWWGSYMYSLEPTDGPAYSTYLSILEKYFVSGSSSSSPSSSSSSTTTAKATTSTTTTAAAQHTTTSTSTSTTAAVEVTTTPNNQVEVSSSASSTTTTAPAVVQTTLVCKPSTTKSASTTTTAASSSSTGGAVAHWYQCGGINWTGATACESGYTCVVQNPYYSQCL